MKLGTKTILSLGMMMTALFIVLYAVSFQIVRNGFSQLEVHHTQQNVERVLKSIKSQCEDLDIKVEDWAVWDDMYKFVRDRNASFIESSLPDACRTLKIHAILILDVSGKVIWSEAYDIEKDKQVTFPSELIKLIEIGSPLNHFWKQKMTVSMGLSCSIRIPWSSLPVRYLPVKEKDRHTAP